MVVSCTEEARAAFAAAFAETDAYSTARAGKARLRAEGTILPSLTYGEVADLDAFARVLSSVPKIEGVHSFFDIGSGAGRALVGAVILLPNVTVACGVEIVRELVEESRSAVSRLRQLGGEYSERADCVDVSCGDALAADWASSDLVFVTATCFTDEMIAAIETDAEKMRPGAALIATTREIHSPYLRLVHSIHERYGKGAIMYRVYERV